MGYIEIDDIYIYTYGGFQLVMGVPQHLDGENRKIPAKWILTGGSLILGNHNIH